MSLLGREEINAKLKNFPGWEIDGKLLRKEFVLPTFTDAMIFVNEVAQSAEDLDHHPYINIHQNTVKIATTSHDLDGITDKDIALIERAQEAEKMIFGELSKT